MAYFPGDDLFQFVHTVSSDLCHDVIDSVDHVGLFDLWNRLQFLDDLVFGPDLGVYENESHWHFLKQPSWWSEWFSFKLSAESRGTDADEYRSALVLGSASIGPASFPSQR